MKHIYVLISLIVLICFTGNHLVKAQGKDSSHFMVKDTTPIELLDYKLSHEQFLYYYGIDDTARAVINMFYRKRQNAVFNFCAPSGGLTLLTAVSNGDIYYLFGSTEVFAIIAAGVGIYVIRGIVQRCTYTRQTLLEILVNRERGQPIPDIYYYKLKPVDFFN